MGAAKYKPKLVPVPKPDVCQQHQLFYSSFIISATTDQRLSSTVHLTSELQLQVMASQVYESCLRSIQYAKPLPCEDLPEHLCEKFEQPTQDSFLDLNEDKDPYQEKSTTKMLLSELERVFLEYADTPQICSSLDLTSLLQLWHNVASILVRRLKKLSWLESASPSHTLPSAPAGLFSTHTCSLLLDRLVAAPATCSSLSHLGLSLVHCHLLLGKQEEEEEELGRGEIRVDVERLVRVVVRYCTLRDEGESEAKEAKDKSSDSVFVMFLSTLAGMRIVLDEGGEASASLSCWGVHVLMMALNRLLNMK